MVCLGPGEGSDTGFGVWGFAVGRDGREGMGWDGMGWRRGGFGVGGLGEGGGGGGGGILLFLQFLDCGNAVAAWRVELYDGGIVRVEKSSVCVLRLV